MQSEENMTRTTISAKPTANPNIVLKREFDGWGLLIDKRTEKSFGINPVAVYIWEHLDGANSIEEILDGIRQNVLEVPPNVEKIVFDFIRSLFDNDLAK